MLQDRSQDAPGSCGARPGPGSGAAAARGRGCAGTRTSPPGVTAVPSLPRLPDRLGRGELLARPAPWPVPSCRLSRHPERLQEVQRSESRGDRSSRLIQRNCTEWGWSLPSPPYHSSCQLETLSSSNDTEAKARHFVTMKVLYTCGYSTSLAALLLAIGIFSCFRKLHCTRNSIHIHFFTSFILRGTAVFIKDSVLFSDESINHCTMSTVTCKAAIAFFQYSVLANFYWLLVEGLYLQTLLLLTFTCDRSYTWGYILMGWGVPMVTVGVWVLTRLHYDDHGCWDDYSSPYWWVIKAPILLAIFVSVFPESPTPEPGVPHGQGTQPGAVQSLRRGFLGQVNFLIFLNVTRMLAQKIRCPDLSRTHKQQYIAYLGLAPRFWGGLWGSGSSQTPLTLHRRLTKSTLLLIPLFGVHYVVFALFPEHVGVDARLYFELVLGSY
ncbi:hypothetical protein IHE44_0010154, partial [Lamprotornis superbus]